MQLFVFFIWLCLLCLVHIVSGQDPWVQLTLSSPNPGNMFEGRSVYCEERDSMLFYGGYRATGPNDVVLVEDLWEYSFPSQSWSVISQGDITWSLKDGFSLNSLPAVPTGTCQVLVIGGSKVNGSDGIVSADSWILNINQSSFATWELLTSTGMNFTGRQAHQTVESETSNSFYLFGGLSVFQNQPTIVFDEFWKFTLGSKPGNSTRAVSTWSLVPVSQNSQIPSSRYDHMMVMDVPGNRLFVHGGRRSNIYVLNDLWMFSLSTQTWTELPATYTLARSDHAGWIDSGRLFIFGGYYRSNSVDFTSSNIFATDLNPVVSVPISQTDAVGPFCTGKTGQTDLWCQASIPLTATVPAGRGGFHWAIRNRVFYVYGGLSKYSDGYNAMEDFWQLDTTLAAETLDIPLPPAPRQTFSPRPPPSSDLPSTLYFMVGVLSFVLLCFMAFIVNLGRRSRQAGARYLIQFPMARTFGARTSYIEALPLKTYKKKVADEETDQIRRSSTRQRLSSKKSSKAKLDLANEIADDLHDLCAICLMDYEDGESLRVLPCQHFFHPACVDTWISVHNACPMCKVVVDPNPEPVNNRSDFANFSSSLNPQFGNPEESPNPRESVATRDPSTNQLILRNENSFEEDQVRINVDYQEDIEARSSLDPPIDANLNSSSSDQARLSMQDRKNDDELRASNVS
jgi:hypothetical protein